MGLSPDQLPLKKTLLIVAITLAFAVIFFLYIQSTFHILRIHGASMQPGLENGDLLLAVSKRKLSRFDLVVFRDPSNPQMNTIKRLIAFPGETVAFRNGQLFINNQPHSWPDSSANERSLQQDFLAHIPQSFCFVLGDNPYNSKDSRQLGPIPMTLVWAQVLFRVWPPRFLHSPK